MNTKAPMFVLTNNRSRRRRRRMREFERRQDGEGSRRRRRGRRKGTKSYKLYSLIANLELNVFFIVAVLLLHLTWATCLVLWLTSFISISETISTRGKVSIRVDTVFYSSLFYYLCAVIAYLYYCFYTLIVGHNNMGFSRIYHLLQKVNLIDWNKVI